MESNAAADRCEKMMALRRARMRRVLLRRGLHLGQPEMLS